MSPAIPYNPRVVKPFRKIFALLLLALLPLQGAAAALSHVACSEGSGMTHARDTGHSHDGHAGDAHRHSQDEGDSGSTQSNHLSCHLTASAIPSLTVSASADIDWVYQPAAPAAVLLFFPEQPQRVPLV
jgi:hypothetical protein